MSLLPKSKTLYFLTALALIAGLGGVLIWQNDLARRPERALSLLPTNVDMHLSGVNYSETEDGREKWALKADSLRYSKKEQQLVFEQVMIDFFNTGMGQLSAKGVKASYDRQTKMVEISGGVSLRDHRGYELTTLDLRYEVNNNRIVVPGPFELTGPNLKLVGQHMTIEIESRNFKIINHGNFSMDQI
jgi:LPS export ABC transporter protein LptC